MDKQSCGSCRWWAHTTLHVYPWGRCYFVLPPLPISIGNISHMLTEANDGTDCPTWAEKEEHETDRA